MSRSKLNLNVPAPSRVEASRALMPRDAELVTSINRTLRSRVCPWMLSVFNGPPCACQRAGTKSPRWKFWLINRLSVHRVDLPQYAAQIAVDFTGLVSRHA